MKRNRPKFLMALFAAAILAVLALGSIPAGAQQGNGKGKLSKHDHELIAEAKANGKDTITVLIAAQKGQSDAVASRLASLGGQVRFRDDNIGYLRATLPIGQAEPAAKLPGVEALDVDEIIPLDDPRPDGAQGVAPQAAPGALTPNNNPYMPIGDTGAAQFTAAHPTWDGRGVTIGILDTGVDLAHPALSTTSTGEPKIVDWVTYTDPLTDDDPTWVNMAATVSGKSFTFNGATYSAKNNGPYRIGLFNERDPRLGGEVGSDVNRDGNPAGSSGVFAVLWDQQNDKVYVDTNQNLSFADETGMKDYKKGRDVGYFGTDNGATAVVERMPFVVQTDTANNFVNIGIVSGAHGTHVAGIMTAKGLFGGAMSGAAPGAKLVSVRVCLFITGCTAHALIEGMIYAAQQHKVDVINMSIGGLPALNDGNNARATLYDNLIDFYGVQIVISAGNSGAGLNTIGDPSVASKVVSAGSYISKATWQSNYGSDSSTVDNMHPFSSRGPREDGGFKPNVIAPGSAISSTPMWQPGGPVGGTFALPPGYSMFNGTSMASPQTAGATALLVSAAKQNGSQRTPAQLRQALYSSARFIAGYGAYEQGDGLIDVGAAWDVLKLNPVTTQFTSSVAVHTLLSGFLATPGVGQGIYDREGVTVGAATSRPMTFTRTSGGGGTKTYNLSWVGNDGTFAAPPTVVLGLNSPVTVNISYNAATFGIHSAILRLDDPATTGIDYETLNTVVAANQFTPGNNYTVASSGTIGRNQSKSFFFNVPLNTPAFKVDFSGPSNATGTGQVRFLRFHPYGVPFDSNSSLANYCPSPSAPTAACPASSLSRTTSNPQAGVWEVTVEARRTSDVASAPFTLTASILGATVSPNPDVIASATSGVPVARSYTITNLFGAFTGRAVGTTLGSANRTSQGPIATGQQHLYQVAVTAGSTSLRATIGGTSDPAADLDLFVFNCTAGPCVLAGQSADGDSEESVTIANPAAGLWVVLIDGFAVPAPTTTYNYVDVFANAAFGSVSVTDANALRSAGASWTVPGSVTANAAPATGRVLLGNVQVRTNTNVLVGQGDVIVSAVTP